MRRLRRTGLHFNLRRDCAVALAHFNLANALARASRLEEAVDHYRTATSLKPDFAEAHDNLGCALAEQGKHDQAIKSFRSSIALRPPTL